MNQKNLIKIDRRLKETKFEFNTRMEFWITKLSARFDNQKVIKYLNAMKCDLLVLKSKLHKAFDYFQWNKRLLVIQIHK